MCALLSCMTTFKTPRTQRGFTQYLVLGILLILVVGTIAFFKYKGSPSPSDLTASLTGTGGVTITTPDNNATLTSPVHVCYRCTTYASSLF